MSGVQTVEVTAADADTRLDRWLLRRYPGLGYGRAQKLCRTGQVRIDGHRAAPGARLSAGQRIRVPPMPPVAAPATRPPPDAADVAWIESRILHQDETLVVIDKPAGLAVQGGTGQHRHIDAIAVALSGGGEPLRLVHRLDKDTSGVLVLARGTKAAARLSREFRLGRARKTYWALVAGVPKPRAGEIAVPLGKRGGPAGERVVPDPKAGKSALTRYRVLDRAGDRAAWLALSPLTGRTHQLRVHCAELGTPILGDGKYGGKAAFLTGLRGGDRLQLHARELIVPHPAGGQLSVTAPLPDHMKATFAQLGFDTSP